MPGVKLNLSRRGISTTIGGRGASVNIGPKGTYLNTSIPGTGISSRKKISGSRSSAGASNYSAAAVPLTPQPPNSRKFSIGAIILAFFGLISLVSAIGDYTDRQLDKANSRISAAVVWLAIAGVYWMVRQARREGKQRRYDVYVAEQARLQAEAEQQRQQVEEARQQAVAEAWQRAEEAARVKEQERLTEFVPSLEKARQLFAEDLISYAELEALKERPQNKYASALTLRLDVEQLERERREAKRWREHLLATYDEATAALLLRREINTGMTRAHVTDCMGHPTKTEKTLVNGKERETLIYGSKTAGSYFHIVGGVVTKAVVR